jgi:hypothetical protein
VLTREGIRRGLVDMVKLNKAIQLSLCRAARDSRVDPNHGPLPDRGKHDVVSVRNRADNQG